MQGTLHPPDTVKLRPIRDVLARRLRSVTVAKNTELAFSPEDSELSDVFSRVRVGSFEDLQLLGFVPRRLAEEKVRRAIEADDDEARRMAMSAACSGQPAPSHTAGRGSAGNPPFRDPDAESRSGGRGDAADRGVST